MTREELIIIGNKMMFADLNPHEDYHALEELFEKNVPHPQPFDFFYNEKFEELTMEEIVDRCLAYKPIQL